MNLLDHTRDFSRSGFDHMNVAMMWKLKCVIIIIVYLLVVGTERASS